MNARILPKKLNQSRTAVEFPERVAIVHDWLPEVGGAERVLGEMLNVFPDADLFSLLDFIPLSERGFLRGKRVQTSFLQNVPLARRLYRLYLPLMPLAIECFDFSQYDLIVSSSYAVAKGLLSGPDQLHVCYCHSPIRYAWDLQEQYLQQTRMHEGVLGLMARALLHYIRLWDSRTPNGVDSFAANSEFVSRRIWKVYRRKAKVIYPPVDLKVSSPPKSLNAPRTFYLSLGRLVPYKRVDLLIEAFRKMPDRILHVIGEGPERARLERGLPANVRLLGRVSEAELSSALESARALVFAAEEDFGIALVEAQAAGTPVIAYAKGGACETVVHGVTGVLFDKQTAEGIVGAVQMADKITFEPADLRRNARRFSPEIFRSELKNWIAQEWGAFECRRQSVGFE